MSKTWFSSDLHGNHRSIMRYTPRGEALGFGPQNEDEELPSAEVARRVRIHNDWMLEVMNFYVQPNDRFYILGDVFFGDKWHAAHWISQIKCKHKILIGGNHDEKLMDFYAKNLCQDLFEEVHRHRAEVKIDGQRFILDHFPLVTWNGDAYGSIHLHGHLHGGGYGESLKSLSKNRILDVGWDNSIKLLGEYRPFELSDVIRLIGDHPSHDHHKLT